VLSGVGDRRKWTPRNVGRYETLTGIRESPTIKVKKSRREREREK